MKLTSSFNEINISLTELQFLYIYSIKTFKKIYLVAMNQKYSNISKDI